MGFEEGVRCLLAWIPHWGFAGVCMFAFPWLRMRSASLRTVSGGSDGHGSAAELSSKGW